MENPSSDNTQGGLVAIGSLNFTLANVIQLAFFICAFLAQWYGMQAEMKEQKMSADSDKRIIELKLEVLESKFQTLEARFNSQSTINNNQK